MAFSTILRRAADNESASRALALATSRDSGGGRVNRMGSFAQAAKMPSATMPCPGALEGAGCLKGKRIEQRKCVQAPPILVMSLVWSTNEPSKEDIKKLMSGFGSSLDLSKVNVALLLDASHRFYNLFIHFDLSSSLLFFPSSSRFLSLPMTTASSIATDLAA